MADAISGSVQPRGRHLRLQGKNALSKNALLNWGIAAPRLPADRALPGQRDRTQERPLSMGARRRRHASGAVTDHTRRRVSAQSESAVASPRGGCTLQAAGLRGPATQRDRRSRPFLRHHVPALGPCALRRGSITAQPGLLRRSAARGAISWLDWEGRPVAAGLSERCGTVLHSIAVGTSLGLATAREAHVLSAVMVAHSNLAMDTGCEWINLGGCMPWLTDGALQNKRHWGAGLVHRPGHHRTVLASWTRWTPAAAALLDLAPVCRHASETFAVTTTAPRGQLPTGKLTLPGVSRLLVVRDGAAPGADGASSAVGAKQVTPGSTAEILAQADL